MVSPEPVNDAEPKRRFTGTRFVIGSDGDSGGDTARIPTETSASRTNDNRPDPSVSRVGRRKNTRKADDKLTAMASETVVGALEAFSVMRYGARSELGNDGRLTPPERKMMSEGIKGSLASLPAEVSDQISSMSAPLMALMGFMHYLVRASNLERRLQAEKAEARRAATASAVMQAQTIVNETNGYHEQTNSSPDLGSIRDIMG